jgi:hypothetical protein
MCSRSCASTSGGSIGPLAPGISRIPAARARTLAILRRWLDAGNPLGNHTYGHPSLNELDVPAYLADLEKGEEICCWIELMSVRVAVGTALHPVGFGPPPAQIRASGTTALGSCLGL